MYMTLDVKKGCKNKQPTNQMYKGLENIEIVFFKKSLSKHTIFISVLKNSFHLFYMYAF